MKGTIFEELSKYVPTKSLSDAVEAKANHIIVSAINLIEYIYENFPEEQAQLMEKRFFSSIKGKDPARFKRASKLDKGE